MRLICLLFVVNVTAQIQQPSWFYNEANLPTANRWMSSLPDDILISELDIPGTHDSGALWDPELSGIPVPGLNDTAKCQFYGIWDQLNMGVRYLDIRCRMYNNAFTIHHGVVYQKINYDEVLTNCKDFLNANPNETILMHVKSEHTSEGCTKSFEQIFADYVRRYPNLFYTPSARFPFLGEARGKIVLVRRFNWDPNQTPDVPVFGINVNAWADNTPYQDIDTGGRTHGAVENVLLQDCYNHTNSIDDKWNYVWNFHKYVINHRNFPRTLILNYISGTLNHWTTFGLPKIKDMAYRTNRIYYDYLEHRMARFHKMGIIVADYIDPILAKSIYKNNFWKNVVTDHNASALLFRDNPTEPTDQSIRIYPIPGTHSMYGLSDLQWFGYNNDTMSGVTIGGNAPMMNIFDANGFLGTSQTINVGHTNLTYMNDKVSSLLFHNDGPYANLRVNGESEKLADSEVHTNLKLFPNPSNGIFDLNLSSELSVSKIEVFDQKGILILSKEMKDQVGTTIDITNQPSGVYLVKIYTGNEIIVKKIVRS